jgi:hypothetical protein
MKRTCGSGTKLPQVERTKEFLRIFVRSAGPPEFTDGTVGEADAPSKGLFIFRSVSSGLTPPSESD